MRLTRAGYGEVHSHTRRAEISLARFEAAQGDTDALQRLRGMSSYEGRDIEQRKASWLARAYAAGFDCATRPAQGKAELGAVLAQKRAAPL